MSNALNYVSFAGRLVYVGITTKEIQFVHPLMHRREMTLLASRNALPEDFRSIISRLEKGDIDTKPWMTHHSTMQSLARDFPTYVSPASGVVKAMVTIDSP